MTKPNGSALKSRIFSALILIFSLTLSLGFFYEYGKDKGIFYGDAFGYYMYLPTTFIYHNHTSLDKLPTDTGIDPWIHTMVEHLETKSPKGFPMNQYTYGVALMESPFFFVIHRLELFRYHSTTGFTTAYENAIKCSSAFYGLLGLFLCYRILRKQYSPIISTCCISLLLIGTNLLWFMTYQQGMAHIPLFFLFALLIYLTQDLYTRFKLKTFALIGLVAGMITLIRPVDGLCVLIPLLYDLKRPWFRNLKDRIQSMRKGIVLAFTCFLLPIIPQLIYWKWLTGSFFFDSYGSKQTLDLLNSHYIHGLFGPSNGWLLYTPVMVVAVLGLFLWKRMGPFSPAVPLLFITYVYVIYAWFVPNYINGFGSRPMIDIYPALTIPMAALLEKIGSQRWYQKLVVSSLILFFIVMNLSFSVQQVKGIISTDNSNYPFYFSSLFRFHTTYNDLVTWDTEIIQPDSTKLSPLQPVYQNDFTDSALSEHVIMDTLTNRKIYWIHRGEESSPLLLHEAFPATLIGNARWMKCAGHFMVPHCGAYIWECHLIVLVIKRKGELLNWTGVRVNNKIGLLENNPPGFEGRILNMRENISGYIRYFVRVPKDIQAGDSIEVNEWNPGSLPLQVRDLQVSFYH